MQDRLLAQSLGSRSVAVEEVLLGVHLLLETAIMAVIVMMMMMMRLDCEETSSL